MISITWFLSLLAWSLPFIGTPKPAAIRIDTQEDYQLLEQFFRMGCSDEEYGYVLEGSKPISIRHFYPPACFPPFKDATHGREEFAKTILARKAPDVWNRVCSNQKKFALKAVSSGSASNLSEIELAFINIPALKKTITQQIDLFRYVLGSSVNPEELVDRIVSSPESLSAILRNNRVLEGIVLGFGSHNSVIGGRVEEIYARTIGKDFFPFLPKSRAMFWSENPVAPEAFGFYFLEYAGGDDSVFNDSLPDMNIKSPAYREEILLAQKMEEPLPEVLSQSPPFIFGAYKGGPENRLFFQNLIQAQFKTRSILKSPHFLEKVLEKIGGRKPKLSFRRKNGEPKEIPLSPPEWIEILNEAINQFQDEKLEKSFLESFCNPTQESRSPPQIVGATPAMLRGLEKAAGNLREANQYFNRLSTFKNPTLKEVVPYRLYIETQGIQNDEQFDLVQISYIIHDLRGRTLFANHDQWISLSETIPGLALGVQGMTIGEKRTIHLHPSLGYGALTTLPPCAGLVIEVELHAVNRKVVGTAPLPIPEELDWIENGSLNADLKNSIAQRPRFLGSFYRDLVDEMPVEDKEKVIQRFLSGLSSRS